MHSPHDTTIRELDHRNSDGIDVSLLWNAHTNRVLVAVEDERFGRRQTFEIDGAEALAAFHHPYAYADDPRPEQARAQTCQPHEKER